MKWSLAHLEIVHEVWDQHWVVVFVHLEIVLDHEKMFHLLWVHPEVVLVHHEVVFHPDQVSGGVCRGFFF
jgi:hypothetical protein